MIDAPPIESTEPKPTMPAIRYFATGPSARTPTVWPISKPCFSAVDLSIAISPSPRGHSPVTSLNGFMALVGGGVEREREPVVDLADRLAGLVDQPCLVFDRPLGVADARQVGDLGQNAG